MCTNKKNKPHAAGTCIRQDGLADRITAGKNSFLFIAYVYIYMHTDTDRHVRIQRRISIPDAC